jgi:hypothetical protein
LPFPTIYTSALGAVRSSNIRLLESRARSSPIPQNPSEIGFDSNGNLFAAVTNSSGSGGSVNKFNPGGAQHTFGGAPGFLSGLAVDSTGNVFVNSEGPNTNSTNTIFKFTAPGTRSVVGSLPGQSFGLAFNKAGNLFAADGADQTLFEFTPGGTRTTFVGPAAFGPNQHPRGQSAFFVWTFDFAGSGTILEFTPGGVEITFATGLTFPRGLAFDSAGNLFVTELSFNGQGGDVLKFTSGGIETVFASGITNPEFLTFGPPRAPAGPNLPDSGSTFAILSIALVALESARRRCSC